MKYKNIFFIGLLVVLTLMYLWYESYRPRQVDWTESYSPKDKIPFGTYITYQSLPCLFPDAKIILSRLSLTEELTRWDTLQMGVYIAVSPFFRPDVIEIKHLFNWVSRGNQAWIAAEWIPDTLLKRLSLEIEPVYEYDSSKLLFGDTAKIYTFPAEYSTYFNTKAGFKGDTLGIRKKDQKPDFIRIPWEKGRLYLNLNPKAYTNYCVLDSVWGDYYYKTLSWLPAESRVVIWDAYRTMGRSEADTPLRVILRYPALKLALYLVLSGIAFYLLFRLKREQRPIPEVSPPENKMLDFIATVSSLYYSRKEDFTIALKQIDFFLGEIRGKYHFSTERLDDTFVRILSERSGIETEKTESLIRLIRQIKTEQQVSRAALQTLMKGTEEFLQKM